MPALFHRLIAVLCLAGSACQSLPDQPYPWPGTVSIGVLPRDKYDWATTMHAYSMPDPDGFGTWWQLSLDPVELLYTMYGGVPDENERGDEREDHIVGDFSFSRDAASFGFGTGVAKNLGDRVMVFSGVGWAMAFEHSYSRDRRGAYDYREQEHLHYLTSGLNLIGGVQYRITPDIGLELGYQSFYETWYIGVAFPF
jgi:hypothetical protein